MHVIEYNTSLFFITAELSSLTDSIVQASAYFTIHFCTY